MEYSGKNTGVCCHAILHPWNSPGKNIGVGSHSLFQGIFPTQESKLGPLHYRQILYYLGIYNGELKSTTVDKVVSVSVSDHLWTQNPDWSDLYERLMPTVYAPDWPRCRWGRRKDWWSWKTCGPNCCPAPTQWASRKAIMCEMRGVSPWALHQLFCIKKSAHLFLFCFPFLITTTTTKSPVAHQN